MGRRTRRLVGIFGVALVMVALPASVTAWAASSVATEAPPAGGEATHAACESGNTEAMTAAMAATDGAHQQMTAAHMAGGGEAMAGHMSGGGMMGGTGPQGMMW